MKTPRKEIIVYDEFEYYGVDYELAIYETDRIEHNGKMVEPKSYYGVVRVDDVGSADIPEGIQTVIEVEKPVETYDTLNDIVENDVTPESIAEILMEDLHDVWESYDVRDLDDLGVEVPAAKE